MTLEIKILTAWIVVTLIFYILAITEYLLSDPNVYWKYYESLLADIYRFILYFGLMSIGIYSIVIALTWWFN